MKRLLIGLALVGATLCGTAVARDAGVSVSIGQPGFYGRIDLGDYPPPALIYPEPLIVQRVHTARPPVYLRVPPGHARHWHKYCHRYRACGEPVYFVQDHWYTHEYVPRYVERRHEWHGGGYAHPYRHDHDRRDYRYDHRDSDRRHGHGRHD